MMTTSELHAIVELLALVDLGDAANYLGEEVGIEELSTEPVVLTFLSPEENAGVTLLKSKE